MSANRAGLRLLRNALPFALVALAAACAPSSPPGGSTTAQDASTSSEDQIARGRRIVYTSGCMDCHTPGTFYGQPDTTRLLSGSELGWQGPWGVSYPRNLTPDSTTGIGKWTEEDIVTAVRQGHRPDGTPLLPPMPWPMYAHLTDADAHALARFLKSIPAVTHKVPAVLRPGEKPTTPVFIVPAPPAWDSQHFAAATPAGDPPAGKP